MPSSRAANRCKRIPAFISSHSSLHFTPHFQVTMINAAAATRPPYTLYLFLFSVTLIASSFTTPQLRISTAHTECQMFRRSGTRSAYLTLYCYRACIEGRSPPSRGEHHVWSQVCSPPSPVSRSSSSSSTLWNRCPPFPCWCLTLPQSRQLAIVRKYGVVIFVFSLARCIWCIGFFLGGGRRGRWLGTFTL